MPVPPPVLALARGVRAGLRAGADLVWPPRCLLCEAPLGDAAPDRAPLCDDCDTAIPWLGAGGCPLCQAEGPGVRCLACRGVPRALVRCRAAVGLDPLVRAWLHRWKYPAPGLAGVDGRPRALVDHLWREGLRGPEPAPGTVVVAVPLHRRRLRRRGFQPAALLARSLARRHRLPLRPALLHRVRDDPSQTGLTRAERRRNVSGAFATAHAARAPRSVWLVDDVVTTGATLAEATRVLAAAGAREVSAFCVARTPP